MTATNRRGRRRASAIGPAFVVPLVILVASACNSQAPRHTVSGRVMYKGEPLPAGVVKLESGDQLVQAPIRPDGTFSATGVPPGQVRVMVTDPPSFLSKMVAKNPRGKSSTPEKHIKDDTPPPKGVAVPKKYKSFDTSGIVLNVNGDMRDVSIDLVD